jgi:hypothetical protein
MKRFAKLILMSVSGPTTGLLFFVWARQLLLHCSTSCIIHRDVMYADIAGANICTCSRKKSNQKKAHPDTA